MKRRIDYFFSMSSQWTYLGHDVFMDIARRHELDVVFRPILLRRLFAERGAVPLTKHHPVRQKYRMLELQRWRELRGMPLNLEPKYWPFDATLVDTFIIATLMAGNNIDEFLRKAFMGLFVDDLDLSDPDVIETIAVSVGLPKMSLEPEVLALATVAYDANFKAAVNADIFGAPSYVLEGEIFWGQDRLEILDDALTSGRSAIKWRGDTN